MLKELKNKAAEIQKEIELLALELAKISYEFCQDLDDDYFDFPLIERINDAQDSEIWVVMCIKDGIVTVKGLSLTNEGDLNTFTLKQLEATNILDIINAIEE